VQQLAFNLQQDTLKVVPYTLPGVIKQLWKNQQSSLQPAMVLEWAT
jgi:hypothetical protein